MLAIAGFFSEMAQLRGRHRTLMGRYVAAVRASGRDVRLTPQSVRNAQANIRRRGRLPASASGPIRRALGPSAVTSLKNEALRADAPSVNTTVSALLLASSAADNQPPCAQSAWQAASAQSHSTYRASSRIRGPGDLSEAFLVPIVWGVSADACRYARNRAQAVATAWATAGGT